MCLASNISDHKVIWSCGMSVLYEQSPRCMLWFGGCECAVMRAVMGKRIKSLHGQVVVSLCRSSLVQPGDLQKAFHWPQKYVPAKCQVLLWTPEEAWKFNCGQTDLFLCLWCFWKWRIYFWYVNFKKLSLRHAADMWNASLNLSIKMWWAHLRDCKHWF